MGVISKELARLAKMFVVICMDKFNNFAVIDRNRICQSVITLIYLRLKGITKTIFSNFGITYILTI